MCARSVRVDEKPSCGARPVNKITKNVGKEVHCERNGSPSDGQIGPGVERINCWQRICRATCKAKKPDDSKRPCEYLKADGTTLDNTGDGNCGGRDKRGTARVDRVVQGDCDDGEIDRIVKTTVKTTETIFKTRVRHHSDEVVGKHEGVTCKANGGTVRWEFDCRA